MTLEWMREDGEPTTFPLAVWIDERGYARSRSGGYARRRVGALVESKYDESGCDTGQASAPAEGERSRVVLCVNSGRTE
jgi:hypothetical protein